MLYAALTFWLLTIVLTAWGVHRLWREIVKPRALNVALLPGTLVAQLGHVLGLLITGATITNTSLFGEESGAPGTTANPKPKIPIVGPAIIGLLPLLTCAIAIYAVAQWFGRPVLADMPRTIVGPVLPTTLAGFWQFLRDQITLTESFVSAMTQAEWGSWQTWLFAYLVICLTVRIAPFPGNLRGALSAVIVLGVVVSAVSFLLDVPDPYIHNTWAVLNLTVAVLLFLLFLSLVVRGGVGLVKLIREPS